MPELATIVAWRREQLQVAADHHHLRVEGYGGGHVEVIPGQDDDIDIAGRVDQPIELAQGVVEVRDEEQAHQYSGSGSRREPGSAAAPRLSVRWLSTSETMSSPGMPAYCVLRSAR